MTPVAPLRVSVGGRADAKKKVSRKERQAQESEVGIAGKEDPSLGARVVLEESTPLQLAKSVKNPAELIGMREAHLRDGAVGTPFALN